MLAKWCVGLAGRAALTVVADEHVPPGNDAGIDAVTPAAAGAGLGGHGKKRGGATRARLVVRNLPDPDLLPPRAEVPDDPPLRAVYIGDVRAVARPADMVEAVAAAPGWVLDVVGPVAAGDRDWLDARLPAEDVESRVRLHGRMPPREAWAVGGGASVGMLLAQDTPAFREAVPTKLYEYLATGLAVLATPMPRVKDLLGVLPAAALVADAEAARPQPCAAGPTRPEELRARPAPPPWRGPTASCAARRPTTSWRRLSRI